MKWFSCNKMNNGVFQVAIDGKESVSTNTILHISMGEYSSVLALITYIEVHRKVMLVDVVVHPNYRKKDLSKAKSIEIFGEINIE